MKLMSWLTKERSDVGRTYRASDDYNVKKARKKSKQKRENRKHKKDMLMEENG